MPAQWNRLMLEWGDSGKESCSVLTTGSSSNTVLSDLVSLGVPAVHRQSVWRHLLRRWVAVKLLLLLYSSSSREIHFESSS